MGVRLDVDGSVDLTWPPPVSEQTFAVRIRREPMRIWVTPKGELDLACAPDLDRHLAKAQAQSEWTILDLRALTFIDCAGLRTVVAAHRRAVGAHRQLEVLCGGGQVTRMLQLTGVARLLELVCPPAGSSAEGARADQGWFA